MARTYYQIFEIAKDLESSELEKKNVEIDEANTRASEAKIALARYVVKHREVCQEYERDMQEAKDASQYLLREARTFIRQQANDTGPQLEGQTTHEILKLLATNDAQDIPARYISTNLYHDTQIALKRASERTGELQEICNEQMGIIRTQSKKMDQEMERFARVVGMMQDKESENRELKAQNDELRLIVDAHENAIRTNRQSQLDQEQSRRVTSQVRSSSENYEENIQARDGEITNLRSKLEKAFAREHDLQSQIRSLLQSSHVESAPIRQGKIMRLLTSGPRGTSNLPTTTSMLNLSQSILTPFEAGRSFPNIPPSPTKSGRSSPTLVGLCDPGQIDKLELPVPYNGHKRTQSSLERGPRLREGFKSSQDRDIDSAVSGRFYHMPANVKSAASILRSQTPKEDGKTSSRDRTSENGRPRQHSAPGNLDLVLDVAQERGYTDRDQQFLINHQRVLSGITEVTEDTGSVQRSSSSPNSEDRKMYMESMRALGRLQGHH